MQGGLFLSILFYSLVAQSILILEPEDDMSGEIIHGEVVGDVACKEETGCELFYLSNDWEASQTEEALEKSQDHYVANMSFGFQRPENRVMSRRGQEDGEDDLSYAELLEQFYKRQEGLESLMTKNPQMFFIAAAGNGYSIGGLYTKGVPLVNRYSMYPQSYTYDHLVKVTSINSSSIDLKKLETYKIADYANYSHTMVDYAAPVETLDDDIKGTSFAAPYISRLSRRAFLKGLSIDEVKEILYKSSYVQGLVKAIELSKNYKENKEDSLIYKIERERKRKDRDALVSQIQPVLLVKSGGPVLEAVFQRCLEIYTTESRSVEEACLQSQNEILGVSEDRRARLKEFWKIREI